MMLGLFLALVAEPVTYGPWRSSQIGGGGYIQNVVFTRDPNVLYSYVDVGGLYQSRDGGKRWRMLHGGLPNGHYEVRGIDVDPADAQRIVVAIGTQWAPDQGVFVSRDGGQSFRQTATIPFQGNGNGRWCGTILARNPRNANVLLAASIGDGIWRSEDRGDTWRKIQDAEAFFTDLKFDPRDPNRVYACAPKTRTWRHRKGQEETLAAAFWRSEDAGKSFRRVANQSPTELLALPWSNTGLLGLVNDRPALTEDGGETWRGLEEGLPAGPVPDGNFTHPARFQALAAGPDFVLTGAANGGVFRRTSRSSAWETVERKSLNERYEGQTWFRHQSGGVGWALGSIVIDPRNPARWFLTDWYAIYESVDAGASWNLSMDGVEATVVHSLAPLPDQDREVLMGMADNGTFLTEDGGGRFRVIEGAGNNTKSLAVAESDPRTVYATGPQDHSWMANRVFRSRDRGRTWTRAEMQGLPDMARHRCNTVAVDPRNAEVVWLAVSGEVRPGQGGPYRSQDGGQTWSWMGPGLPEGETYFREAIWTGGRELAVGPSGLPVAISFDRNRMHRWDGKRWQRVPVPEGPAFRDLVADGRLAGRYWVGRDQNGGVLRSDDGGANWKEVRAGAGAPIAVRDRQVAAATGTSVAYSGDAGETWEELSSALPHKSLAAIGLHPRRIYVGTTGSGVFWAELPRR